MLIDPTVQEFKEYFTRDFPYGDDINENILDADITKAIGKAAMLIKKECFSLQPEYTQAFLYLTAHHLVLSIRTSSQGLGSSFSHLVNSKSVGGVSESYEIPEWLLKTPLYAQLSQTGYGSEYLFLIMPCLIGPVFAVGGATLA